jgi:hypothetical protein
MNETACDRSIYHDHQQLWHACIIQLFSLVRRFIKLFLIKLENDKYGIDEVY